MTETFASPLRIVSLTGEALVAALPALADLRIRVIRAYPYLSDGDPDYELRYLAAYARSPEAIVAGALDGDHLVGAATAAPMEGHAAAFARPFGERGYRLEDILYLGESVLLPQYRGRGTGHDFFDRREAYGRDIGRRHAAFCAVIRPDDHPMRPAGYCALDPFWEKRGYRRVEGLVATFPWTDIGDSMETEKPMQFWMRAI